MNYDWMCGLALDLKKGEAHRFDLNFPDSADAQLHRAPMGMSAQTRFMACACPDCISSAMRKKQHLQNEKNVITFHYPVQMHRLVSTGRIWPYLSGLWHFATVSDIF